MNQSLRQALVNADLVRAAELLSAGADVNGLDACGELLISEIIEWGPVDSRIAIVRFMLEHGANPNLFGPDATGPLFSAVLRQDTEMIRLLLDRGADPNRDCCDGEMLLDWAEFDYRHEVFDLRLPESPTDADKSTMESWLQFLDRIARKRGMRRPDYLILLRERGARTAGEA